MCSVGSLMCGRCGWSYGIHGGRVLVASTRCVRELICVGLLSVMLNDVGLLIVLLLERRSRRDVMSV